LFTTTNRAEPPIQARLDPVEGGGSQQFIHFVVSDFEAVTMSCSHKEPLYFIFAKCFPLYGFITVDFSLLNVPKDTF
jgi:hypothetical protein